MVLPRISRVTTTKPAGALSSATPVATATQLVVTCRHCAIPPSHRSARCVHGDAAADVVQHDEQLAPDGRWIAQSNATLLQTSYNTTSNGGRAPSFWKNTRRPMHMPTRFKPTFATAVAQRRGGQMQPLLVGPDHGQSGPFVKFPLGPAALPGPRLPGPSEVLRKEETGRAVSCVRCASP
jgi:hypothetical protein